jgi:acetyl esterase/lipase
LANAGVAVTTKRYDGQIHAFWQMLAVLESSGQAADAAAAELRQAFSTTPSRA